MNCLGQTPQDLSFLTCTMETSANTCLIFLIERWQKWNEIEALKTCKELCIWEVPQNHMAIYVSLKIASAYDLRKFNFALSQCSPENEIIFFSYLPQKKVVEERY